MSKGDIAKEYFMQGYNCSQAVAMSFADEMNIDKAVVAKLASGFGGGMGRMREVCGTVSGMTMVLSMVFGYDDPKANAEKAQLYSRVQELGNRFKLDNGSIICRELLELQKDGFDAPIPEARTKTYYKKRPCADLVKYAGDILEDYLEKNK